MSDAPTEEEITPASMGDLLEEYLNTLSPEDHNTAGVYVRKYVEYIGSDFPVTQLTGARVESYAEAQIRPSDPNAKDRVQALKTWFQYLKKKAHTHKNYGIHIRLRKAGARGAALRTPAEEEAPIEMTADGLVAMKAELDTLQESVPNLVQAVASAREDGDVRENAPLDAAREALAFNEQRRRAIDETLKRAVVVESMSDDGASRVGSVVTVIRLDNDKQVSYTLVSAREANAKDAKISVESPVGKELLGCRPGDQVTVKAPRGEIQFRVETVVRS